MPAASQAALFDPERTFGVGEVVARVRQVVASALPGEVWVRGEVHGLRSPTAAGHLFFELGERNNRRGPLSTLPVAMFKDDRERVERELAAWPDFRLADGLEVRLKGRVQYAYGRVQLVVSAVDPVHTLGRLAADRQRTLRALAADGLVRRQAELPFPLLPLRVGLITSTGSAAYEDVMHELVGSGFGFRVLLADARVQGNGAELSMVRALHALREARCDVVLLVRGGGSRTDLVAFDGERLARTVATMPVPVITGVGHEIDTSVADEVAHLSRKTPTACAAEVVERVRAAVRRSEHAWEQIARRSTAALDRAESHVAAATERVSATALGSKLDRLEAAVAGCGARTRRAAAARLHHATSRLDVLDARLASADPVRALARGWSLTRNADGQLLRGISGIGPGDELLTVLADGTVRSVVTEVMP